MRQTVLSAFALLALVCAVPAAYAQVQQPQMSVVGQMCVGNIGKTTPVRIFIQPVEKGGILYVDFWAGFIKDSTKASLMEPDPTYYPYSGRFPLSVKPGGKYTFTTAANSRYELTLQGDRLVGTGIGNQGYFYYPDLPCHPSTTKVK